MAPFTPLFIDGQQLPSSDGSTFEIRNPFSKVVVGNSASATSEDCQNAIISAGKAFKTWEHSSLDERCDIFLRAAELLKLDRYKDRILKDVIEETAAAPVFAKWGTFASGLLHDIATLINELDGVCFPSRRVKGGTVAIERRAMGVMYVILASTRSF